MSKAFSIADLQSGAKRLNNVQAPTAGASIHSDSKSSFDSEALIPLEELYLKYDGDLDLIFKELNANPSKAKKPHHRPKNAKEFADKYLAGYYSIVEEERFVGDSDSKGHK